MLSVAIIARDEERYIDGCLASVAGLADEIVVLLDERSRDGTATICRAYGVRLYSEPWRSFPAQRNRALALCSRPWVLFVDADERVTPALAAELRAICGEPAAAAIAGYGIPRYNLFFGRRLRGGGWYPDHQLRLLRRGQAHYNEGLLVHEVADLSGPAGKLRGHLLHHNIDRLDEFWRKQRQFALIEAQTLYGQGRRARLRNFVGAPLRELWRRYVLLNGWRDGWLGLFLCATLAWFELIKFLRLWGWQRSVVQ